MATQLSLLDNILSVNYECNFIRREFLRPDVYQAINNIKQYLPNDKWYSTKAKEQIDIDLNLLERFRKSIKSDKGFHYIDVEYTRDSYGRFYAKNNVSLQTLWGEARNTLLDKDRYIDFDIHNCCPQILKEITDDLHLKNDNLTYYCNNRNKCLNDIMKDMNISKNNAKNLFIRLLFGGSLNTFIKDMIYDEPDFNADFKCKWIHDLFKEMDHINDFFLNYKGSTAFNHLRTFVMKKKKDNLFQGIKKDNIKGSLLATLLFTIENHINHIATQYIKKYKGLSVDASIHDGFHIRLYNSLKKPNDFSFSEDDKNELCNEVSKYILQETGLHLTFTIKDFNENYDNAIEYMKKNITYHINGQTYKSYDKISLYGGEELTVDYINHGVKNEYFACQKILQLYPYFKQCDGYLYCLDWESGYWSTDKNIHIKMISMLWRYIRQIYEDDKKGESVSDTDSYGTKASKITKVLQILPSMCMDNLFIKKSEGTSMGCLLFKNGWLDARKSPFVFYNKKDKDFKWDRSIYFFNICDYDYVERGSTDTFSYIKKNLIYNPLGEEQGNYLLQYISCALFGRVDLKKILFALGCSNSGKNTITMALYHTFGSYFGNFNAENLCSNKFENNDTAQALRWFYLLSKKRIIASNELDQKRNLNGNLIKKVASGGDIITARMHRENESEFISNALSIIFANDLPYLSPLDDAVKNRVRIITFNKTFVDKPLEECNEFELPKDNTFCEYVNTPDFRNHFIHILIDYYQSFMKNGFIEPQSVIQNFDEWVDDENDVIKSFFTYFEITNREDDFITNDLINDLILKKNDVSQKKFVIEFKKYLKINKNDFVKQIPKKLNGKKHRVWIGIKSLEDDEVIEE